MCTVHINIYIRYIDCMAAAIECVGTLRAVSKHKHIQIYRLDCLNQD